MLRLALAFALFAGCAVPETPDAPRDEAWAPVATYLGTDDATGAQIAELLDAHGITSVAAGSLGYTVNVAASRAAEARSLLADAIGHGLRASVL